MIATIKVTPVTFAPRLITPEIVSGIRDKAAAEAWAKKHGYATVYFFAKKQRVYAERLTVRVDEKAEQIEQASEELLKCAEAAL
jgi:hypothetical protein